VAAPEGLVVPLLFDVRSGHVEGHKRVAPGSSWFPCRPSASPLALARWYSEKETLWFPDSEQIAPLVESRLQCTLSE